MHLKPVLYITLGLLTFAACTSEPPVVSNVVISEAYMKPYQLSVSLQQKHVFKELPSASGIERVGDAYYIVGDDSPYLYQLDEQFKLVERHVLFDTADFATGRIPKPVKPDLESMAHFKYGRDEMLLLLGSGSSEVRNRAFLVNLTEGMQVQELDFTRFHTFLKRVIGLAEDGELNLEGFAMDDTYTYIMQRAIAKGANVLFRFNTNDFKGFVMNNRDLPAAAVYYFTLPELEKYQAGFSGAFAYEDKLFFTASVESAPNAIEDGEVLGSVVGVVQLKALYYATDPTKPLQVPAVQLMNDDESIYTGKAESLVVRGGRDGIYDVVVVTDDDQGGSELLEIQLEVSE